MGEKQTLEIVSKCESLGYLGRTVAEDTEIEQEPQMFGATLGFADQHAGPLTRLFLNALDANGIDRGVIIDSRSHMLMPGFYPCIPGWHLDELARGEDGQPVIDDIGSEGSPVHILCLLGSVSPTQFVTDRVVLPRLPEVGRTLYGTWSPIITRGVSDGQIQTRSARPGEVIRFRNSDFHQGVPASHIPISPTSFFSLFMGSAPTNPSRAQACRPVFACGSCWRARGVS